MKCPKECKGCASGNPNEQNCLSKDRQKFEEACKEFLKGCSCAPANKPQDCQECLDAFVNRIKELAEREIRCQFCGEYHTDDTSCIR